MSGKLIKPRLLYGTYHRNGLSVGFAHEHGHLRVLQVGLAPFFREVLLEFSAGKSRSFHAPQKLDGNRAIVFNSDHLSHFREVEDVDHQDIFRAKDVVGAQHAASHLAA